MLIINIYLYLATYSTLEYKFADLMNNWEGTENILQFKKINMKLLTMKSKYLPNSTKTPT